MQSKTQRTTADRGLWQITMVRMPSESMLGATLIEQAEVRVTATCPDDTACRISAILSKRGY